MYLVLNPLYSRLEGFGTLMSHYSVMYNIHKDIGFTPIILDINFKGRNLTSCMDFFNLKFNQPILYHQNVFKNMKSIFEFHDENWLREHIWKNIDLQNMDYGQLLDILKSQKSFNLICSWSLSNSLVSKYSNEIYNFLYDFDNEFFKECQNLLPKTDKEIVGICVRNEYKRIKTPHIRLSINYYKEAMNRFDIKNTKFLIFSDFIDEAKSMFYNLQKTYDIEYTQDMQSAVGMCLMSQCDHIISANSSFSYWAAVLNKNKNKKIVCCSKFIDENKNKNFANLLNYKWYPSSWIALDVI